MQVKKCKVTVQKYTVLQLQFTLTLGQYTAVSLRTP